MNLHYHLKIALLLGTGLILTACDRTDDTRVAKTVSAPEKMLNYHAIIIGIDDYSGTGWPKLNTPTSDAQAVGETLRSAYGFQVTELIDKQASRKQILQTLDQTMNLTDNDALLIYYAGHGYYDQKMDEGYWIPHGALREQNGHPAKDEWLWNSSINRLVDASPAKHILVIADTCYGGSLFRGEENTEKTSRWYQRAAHMPSRYLISSGNLEPVLDSGIRHSVFAQEILNFLKYTDADVFSASDIGVGIRSKVSDLTDQLVRIGRLNSAADAGGEFIFVRNSADFPMNQTHATNTVITTDHIPRGPLEDLSARIQSYTKTRHDFVRPRILACIGPTGEDQTKASLIRKRLYHYLKNMGGCIIVERNAFNSILQEIELSSSGQADPRAAAEIGKLLPASLILFGELIPVNDRQEIHLRIVDTETSRVLDSTFESFSSLEELDLACQTLAGNIMKTMNEIRPILLPTLFNDHGHLTANWGRFHGARIGDSFEIIQIKGEGTVSRKKVSLGSAVLMHIEEERSELQQEWLSELGNRSESNLWLKANPR